jgi:hypothetical protein
MRRSTLLLAACLALLAGFAPLAFCLAQPAPGGGLVPVLDVQELRILVVDPAAPPARELAADLCIAGGGLGGSAAALAACEAGLRVILTEETRWLGGQLSAQGVSVLDENYWVESGGATRSYQALRAHIRAHYRAGLRAEPAEPAFNPGNCWASRLAFEPAVGAAAIDSLLAPQIAAGRLTVLRRHKVYNVERAGDRLGALSTVELDTGATCRIEAAYFLEATPLGDLLPLAGVEHAIGAEAQSETGEPSAPARANPDCVQAFTYSFILEKRPGESHLLAAARDCGATALASAFAPTQFAAPGLFAGAGTALALDEVPPGAPGSLWTYRRLIDSELFTRDAQPYELALVNLPAVDYRGGSLLSGTPLEQLAHLEAAKTQSLCCFHWLQHEWPRGQGKRGYPELRLRQDLFGTEDALPMHPYIREARRLKALKTLREQDVAAAQLPGALRGRFFMDAVGIGAYGIDIHPGPCDEALPPPATRPFQIPLGALIPKRVENLLAAGKSLGTTHIANGCYRMHPIEWAIGEAAGCAVVECLAAGLLPSALRERPEHVLALQRRLVARGAPIYWYANLGTQDAAFAEAQMAPFLSAERRAALERSSEYPLPEGRQ